jgi:NAD(P)-dependent dehydrogenase (short-subunit alcohol dehydrogenase family)
MSASHELKGRVVIVTGAGKGLGRAYALDMARRGARVIVNNRWTDATQPSSADAVVAEIRALGGEAVADYGEAERAATGPALVELALATFGRLDAVVSNAGVPQTSRLHRQTAAGFQRIFDINFYGAFHLVHAAWGALSEAPAGRIVLSASSAGLYGGDGMAAYASSKAALIGLVRGLAVEGRQRNLMINAIAPYAATAMTTPHLSAPLVERMDPADVAPLVSWLVSEECDISGLTLVSGGGRLRAARSVEGPPVLIGGDVGAAVRRAVGEGPYETYNDAHEAFAAFMDGRPALRAEPQLQD